MILLFCILFVLISFNVIVHVISAHLGFIYLLIVIYVRFELKLLYEFMFATENFFSEKHQKKIIYVWFLIDMVSLLVSFLFFCFFFFLLKNYKFDW